jgi:glycosyltransferase involved in cell wall biosynthesis
VAKLKVTVIIPTRNEEGCIGRVLREMPRKIIDEVVIVDGHSTDKTVEEVKSQLKSNDKFIIQKGYGYGAAFRQGFKLAKGEIIVMMDGDGSHNPKDIKKIIEKFGEGYGYVLASRYIPGGISKDDTLIRFLGNKIFTFMTNVIHGTKVSDSLYLYTAISKKALKNLKLKSQGFEFCTEILVKAHRAGLKFAEVPVVERARFAGKSKVNAFWHGLKVLQMILRNY